MYLLVAGFFREVYLPINFSAMLNMLLLLAGSMRLKYFSKGDESSFPVLLKIISKGYFILFDSNQ